jgi:hypothetical protein
VVRFEPVGPEDVDAAEQETDYVNHVFMQQNPGFLALYSFIKDVLLSKVGIVKVWWETREEIERETYLDLDDAAFAIISADPDVEIVEHTVRNRESGVRGQFFETGNDSGGFSAEGVDGTEHQGVARAASTSICRCGAIRITAYCSCTGWESGSMRDV